MSVKFEKYSPMYLSPENETAYLFIARPPVCPGDVLFWGESVILRSIYMALLGYASG